VSLSSALLAAAIAIGLILTGASIRSLVRDMRTGVVRGRVNNFRRDSAPAAFWLAIVATALAGLVGVALLAIGLGVIG
jgi:hypothetical protein